MNVKIERALLSVSDKEGLIDLARFLAGKKIELIATGGTAQKLSEAGIAFTPIEQITGNPEAFGGRMKTLSFQFLSGLLFRRDIPQDVKTAAELKVKPIDLVVCNFYPFQAAMQSGASDPDLVEQIDIGGPTMVRAAAKNFAHVVVCTSSAQYAELIQTLESTTGTSFEMRRKFAVQAFALTAHYETMIAEELARRFDGSSVKYLRLQDGQPLRYGENPHQKADFFRLGTDANSLAAANSLQGKALSYNNLLDADAAHRAASDIALLAPQENCAVAVVKHLNPCGLAQAPTPLEALKLAWAGDPISAFGGILYFSKPLDTTVTDWLEDKFIEVIMAPAIAPAALTALTKKKNLRVLLLPPKKPSGEKMLRSVSGGILVQDEDEGIDTEFKTVTQKVLPKELMPLAEFAVMAAKHLKSNAIALVRAPTEKSWQLVGAGMGQPNRVDSLRLLAGPRALDKTELQKCLLASDAFFPFPDIVEVAAEMGLQYLLQPGGSMRDEEVVQACDRLGVGMVFTGRRHFRH